MLESPKTLKSADLRIRRAAGIIMHLIRRGPPKGVKADPTEYAIARAQEHEPGLTESEIGIAYDWAINSLEYRDAVEMAGPDTDIYALAQRFGLTGGGDAGGTNSLHGREGTESKRSDRKGRRAARHD